MLALAIIVGYILMIFGFCLWDSWIGMPVRWDSFNESPKNVGMVAMIWPISIPIIALVAFSEYLDRAKKRRQDDEWRKQKLRIAAEKELENYQREVEEEVQNILHERKDSNHA